jgi:hypothetical protein
MPPMLDQTTPGKKKTHPPKKMGQEDEEDALYRSLPKNIQPQKPAIETGEPTRLSFCRYDPASDGGCCEPKWRHTFGRTGVVAC